MFQRFTPSHLILLIVSVTFSQNACSSRAQGTLPPVVRLEPVKSFRLSTSLPRMEDAAVDPNGNLYFLMSEKGHFQVIRSTDSGEVAQTTVIPPAASSMRKIVAGPNGVVAVLLVQGAALPDVVHIVDGNTGQLINSISSSEKLSEICFLGSQLVGVSSSQNRLVNIAGGGTSISAQVLPDPIRIAAIDDHRIAVIQMVSGQLEVVGPTAAIVNPAVLLAPELQGIERPQIPPGEGWTAMIHTIAATSTRIFVGPTGGKRQEGAPVLELDTNGVLRRRYQCVLPTFGQDPSQHGSYMFAGKLLAFGSNIIWISQSEHKVAEYSLPPQS